MSAPAAEALQQYLRRLCERATAPSDVVLLKRFAQANDRDAFAMLVARHGPMVLGSARRLVGESHDAEDVFQAVFLSLARLAKTIRKGQTLPAWLHKATCRIAAKVRQRRGRATRAERTKQPGCAEQPGCLDPAAGLVWQEVRQALDEELQRLPDRLRSPLVLCYLSGLTRDEAAQQLGWSLGTLKRRLEEGRTSLRVRLERRGIAAVGLALSVLTPEALQAAVSKSLVESSVSLGLSKGVVPAAISCLVLSSAGAMNGVVMKSIVALLVAIAFGVGIYAGTGAAQDAGAGRGSPDPAQGSTEGLPAGGDRRPAVGDSGGVERPASSAEKQPNEKVPFTAWGEKQPSGVQIGLGYLPGQKRIYRTGETVTVVVRVRNVGKQAVHFEYVREFEMDSPLVIVDGAGKKYPTPDTVTDLVLMPTKLTLNAGKEADLYRLKLVLRPAGEKNDKEVMKIYGTGKFQVQETGLSGRVSTGNARADTAYDQMTSGKLELEVNDAEQESEGDKPTQEGDQPTAKNGDQKKAGDDPLPAGATLRFGTTRFRHGIRVESMTVSPDGKMAFVTHDSHPPRAFDLASGRVLFSLNWASVESAAFSPDGRTLVFRQDHALYIRDPATGNEIRKIEGPRQNPWRGLEFTPDGKAIAMMSNGNVVHLIDYQNGQTIRDFVHESPDPTIKNDFSQVLAVAFSPDGKLMATGGYAKDKDNYVARLWDVETGAELRRFLHGQQGYGISSLAFSPDGKTLATLGTQAGVLLRLFDVNTGELRKAFPKDDGVRPGRRSVAFTPDGKTVAAAGTAIRLYDTTTGEERLRIDRRASNLQFTEGGKTLTGAVGGTVYRWDTATGKSLIPEAGDSVVDQILVTADGKRVITRGQDGYAHIWDGASAKHLRRFQAGWMRPMAISPDGRFLAWAVDDDKVRFKDPATPDSIYYGTRIRLYDIAADKFVDRFPAFKGGAQDVAFTGDGKKLVTVDRHPGTVRIWDFEGAKEERNFPIVLPPKEKKTYIVTQTLLSPDGKTAVVTYQEWRGGLEFGGLRGPPQHIRLWDVATGTELPRLNGDHPGRPVVGAFSPDGRLVVTSAGKVFETATGKQVEALAGDLYIRAAAFSRDGRLLATTGPGDAMQLWDTTTWTKQTEYKGHRDQPTALAFTPAGQLLSGSIDTTVLAWDTPAAKK